MAIAVFFRRTAEQNSTVVYEFGPSPDQTDRHLVIDTVTEDVRPAAGIPDHVTVKVALRILRLRHETGTWPETGGYFA